VLTVVSTVVGGGIVGLPYSMVQLGLWPTLVIMAGMSFQTSNSSWLYLKSKDLIEGQPESLYEIGYVLFERSSIFVISFILFVTGFGMVMIYLIIFGKTSASVIKDCMAVEPVASSFSHFLTEQTFSILVISALLLPVILKKELQELHFVSLTLFVALLVFIVVLFLQLVFLGANVFSEGDPVTMHEFHGPSKHADFLTLMSSYSAILIAYCVSTNLFPLYSALKEKTNENCYRSISISVIFVSFIYLFLCIVSILLFGNQVIKEDADILGNINKEFQLDSGRWESFLLRVLFLVVLACHIPFVFFFGKESLLIIIDEVDRRSISQTLEIRLNNLRAQRKRVPQQQKEDSVLQF